MSHLVATDHEAAFTCGRAPQTRGFQLVSPMYSSDAVGHPMNTNNVERLPAFAMTAVANRPSDRHFNGHAIHDPSRPVRGSIAAYDSLIDLSPSRRPVLLHNTDAADANVPQRLIQMFDPVPASTMQYCLGSQASGVGCSAFVSTSGAQGLFCNYY